MKKLFLLMIFLIPVQSQAVEFFQDFREGDVIRQVVFTGLVFIDLNQTKAFRAKGQKELNAALGEEPSQEEIDTMIGLGTIGHALVTWAIPPEWRETWQMFSIGAETCAVYANYRNAEMSVGFTYNFK